MINSSACAETEALQPADVPSAGCCVFVERRGTRGVGGARAAPLERPTLARSRADRRHAVVSRAVAPQEQEIVVIHCLWHGCFSSSCSIHRWQQPQQPAAELLHLVAWLLLHLVEWRWIRLVLVGRRAEHCQRGMAAGACYHWLLVDGPDSFAAFGLADDCWQPSSWRCDPRVCASARMCVCNACLETSSRRSCRRRKPR